MSAVVVEALPDVHAGGDARGVDLDAVGVAGVALPVNVLGPDGSQQATVAEAELTVALAAEVRGTHMSRFVEEAATLEPITPATLVALAASLCERLEASTSRVLFRFPL